MFIAVANGDKGSVECVNDDCDDQHMVIIVGRACSLYLLDLYYILFFFFYQHTAPSFDLNYWKLVFCVISPKGY